MRKIVLSMTLLSTAVLNAHAGSMGPVASGDYFVPFIEGEAAATWNTTKSVTLFDSPPSLNKDVWGGRGAVGLAHFYSNHWGYSAEVGWGYYGHTNSSAAGTVPAGTMEITNSSYLYGFDLLAGVSYSFDPVQIFFKAGAMSENRRAKGNASLTGLVNGEPKVTTSSISSVATNVLPELKVGGLYAFNEHLSATLAYMHVFGNNNFSATVSGGALNPTAISGISSVISLQDPSLDSVLFGLVYQFV